jgi:hypothetical protein
VHGQLRNIIKPRGHVPNDEAATTRIWLARRNITAKWARGPTLWRTAMNQFAILSEDAVSYRALTLHRLSGEPKKNEKQDGNHASHTKFLHCPLQPCLFDQDGATKVTPYRSSRLRGRALRAFVPSCLRVFVPSCLRVFVVSWLRGFVVRASSASQRSPR